MRALPSSWPEPQPRWPAAWRSSIARDLELAPDVEARDLLEPVGRPRPPPLRLHLLTAVAIPRLGRVPAGASDYLVRGRPAAPQRPQLPCRNGAPHHSTS